ncbi:MAG: hypothetical protein HYT88_07255, partial [Candidatus Omnitrophica bacterium]|nr:hypothetical protein [Candidatus Omnitrophota bacterium]
LAYVASVALHPTSFSGTYLREALRRVSGRQWVAGGLIAASLVVSLLGLFTPGLFVSLATFAAPLLQTAASFTGSWLSFLPPVLGMEDLFAIGGVFGIAYTVLILRSVLRRALGRAPPQSYQAITSASSLDVLMERLEKQFADPRDIAKALKQMAERGQLGPSIQPDVFDKPGWEWVKELNLSEAALYHILIEAFRAASKAEPKKSTHQEGPAFLSQYLHIFQEYLRMPLTITTLWVVNSFLIKPLTGATQQFVFGANRDFHDVNGIENIVATEFAKQLGAKGLGEKALPTILPTSWVAKAAEKGLDRMERRAAEIALGKRNLISLPILMLLTAFIGIGRFLTSRFVFSAISKFVAPFIVFGLLGPAGLLVS